MAGIREGQRCRLEPVAAVGESLDHHAPMAAVQTIILPSKKTRL